MTQKKEIKEKCFICWNEFKYYMTGKDFDKQTTTKDFDIYKCSSCGVEKIFPEPSIEEILSFYPKDYYSFHIKDTKKRWFTTPFEKILNNIYHNKCKFIKHILQRRKMGVPYEVHGNWYFLDVWCWDEYMIELMQKLWRKAYGFEIWEKKKIGNITYESDIQEADFWKTQFDFIRIAHVLEHISNPIQFLQKIKKILAPNGIVELTLPNTKSFDAKAFGKYRSNRDIPRHLINYDINNLDMFFRKQWFIVIRKKYMLWFGFSWSLKHVLKYKYKKNIKRLDNIVIRYLCLWIDFILSVLHRWDHMWFTIKKK